MSPKWLGLEILALQKNKENSREKKTDISVRKNSSVDVFHTIFS
jgi:hypothetical protein